MNSERETSGDKIKKEPVFKNVAIFYNFVFDIGKTVNPTEAARELLKEDFTLSAPNYLTDDVELATRFNELHKIRQQAMQVSELSLCLKKDGAKGLTKWILRHPNESFRLLNMALKARKSKNIEKKQETNEKKINTNSKRDVQTIMQEAINIVDEAMIRIQLFEALQRQSDRDLFSPIYLREIPFVRVGLQPFHACINGEDLDIDVGLLIHRTGVSILTFYALYSEEKNTEEIIELSKSKVVKITRSRIARAIVEPQANSIGLNSSELDKVPFKREVSSGVEWFIYEKQENTNLLEIFFLYQMAVTSTVLGKKPKKSSEPFSWLRCPDWITYPILFIRQISPDCSTDMPFKKDFSKNLAGIILRSNTMDILKDEKIDEAIADDFSLTNDHSLFVGSGHTTVLYYGSFRKKLEEQYGNDIPGHEWLYHHFQTSSIIDVLLIQRWILYIYHSELNNISYNMHELNSIKKNLILALEEYHNVTLSYGSAQEIINFSRQKFGIEDKYNGIKSKLHDLEKLIEVEESNNRNKRDLFLRVSGIKLTLMFGLSGADQVVKVISLWNALPQTRDSSFLIYLYNYLVDYVKLHPILTTLSLYGILFVLVFCIIIWSLLPIRKKKRVIFSDQSGPAFTHSFTWPTKIQFEHISKSKTKNFDGAINKEKFDK